jgi:hypothetical protein
MTPVVPVVENPFSYQWFTAVQGKISPVHLWHRLKALAGPPVFKGATRV